MQIINKITADSFMNQTINTTVENTIRVNGYIGYIQVNIFLAIHNYL